MIPKQLLNELFKDIRDICILITKKQLEFMDTGDIRWIEFDKIHEEPIRYLVFENCKKIIILQGTFVKRRDRREYNLLGDNVYHWNYYPNKHAIHNWVGRSYRCDVSSEFISFLERIADICEVELEKLIYIASKK